MNNKYYFHYTKYKGRYWNNFITTDVRLVYQTKYIIEISFRLVQFLTKNQKEHIGCTTEGQSLGQDYKWWYTD